MKLVHICRVLMAASVFLTLVHILKLNLEIANFSPTISEYVNKSATSNRLLNRSLEIVVNPHDYKFTIKMSKSCALHPNIQTIVIVHSAIGNVKKRAIIRKTWGDVKMIEGTRLIVRFFLGKSKSREENMRAAHESWVYGDVIVQDFLDSYRNLTLKAMSWLEWITMYCPQPKYVLKVDDDMAIDVFNLNTMFRELSGKAWNKSGGSIYCKLRVNEPVLRKPNKWVVSQKEYPNNTYPKYCPGIAVIFDRALIDLLHVASYYVPFFWIDDVYFSGLLREYVGAEITDIGSRYAKLGGRSSIFELIQNDTVRTMRWNEVLKLHNLAPI